MGDLLAFPLERNCMDCVNFTMGLRGSYCVEAGEWILDERDALGCEAYEVAT